MDEMEHSIKFLNYLRSLKKRPMRDWKKEALTNPDNTKKVTIDSKTNTTLALTSYRQIASPAADQG